jgi:hypothetical protein
VAAVPSGPWIPLPIIPNKKIFISNYISRRIASLNQRDINLVSRQLHLRGLLGKKLLYISDN